jgi:hypothetical protein
MEDKKKPLLTALATLFADVDAKIQKEEDWRMIYDVTLAEILIGKGIVTEEEFKARVLNNTDIYKKVIIERVLNK